MNFEYSTRSILRGAMSKLTAPRRNCVSPSAARLLSWTKIVAGTFEGRRRIAK
jgi:hypothetical protein